MTSDSLTKVDFVAKLPVELLTNIYSHLHTSLAGSSLSSRSPTLLSSDERAWSLINKRCAEICRVETKTPAKLSSVLRVDDAVRDITGLNQEEADKILNGTTDREKFLKILSSCKALDNSAWYFPCHDWETAGTLQSNSEWLTKVANFAKDVKSSFGVKHIIMDSQTDGPPSDEHVSVGERSFEDNAVISKYIQLAERFSKPDDPDSTVQVHCIVNRSGLAPGEFTGGFGFSKGPVGPGRLSLYGTIDRLNSYRHLPHDYPCHMHRRWHIVPIAQSGLATGTSSQDDDPAQGLVDSIFRCYIEEGQNAWHTSVDLSIAVGGSRDLKEALEAELSTAVAGAWDRLEKGSWDYKPDPLPQCFVEGSSLGRSE